MAVRLLLCLLSAGSLGDVFSGFIVVEFSPEGRYCIDPFQFILLGFGFISILSIKAIKALQQWMRLPPFVDKMD